MEMKVPPPLHLWFGWRIGCYPPSSPRGPGPEETYNAIMQHSPAKPVLIFVSSRRQTRLTALDLINFLAADQREKMFVRMSEDDLEMVLEQVTDQHLRPVALCPGDFFFITDEGDSGVLQGARPRHTLNFGIGLHHAGICKEDKAIVEKLFFSEKIQVLVATSTLAWGVNFPAHLVVVKGTEFYDGKTKTYVDYPTTGAAWPVPNTERYMGHLVR